MLYALATGVVTDQRGLLRPWPANGKVDIGAYEYQPVVTGISPATGSTGGGTPVTITGIDLSGATAVDFGTTAATNVIVQSPTEITAMTPAGNAGTVHVTVVTSSGTSATSSADRFAYVGAAPSISFVSGPNPPNPIAADASNNAQTLTIMGTNFVSTPTVLVTWNGGSKTLSAPRSITLARRS